MLRFFWPHGYRNVRIPGETPPRFGRINLLVGPNSAGKSNFIKAMGFLPDMLLCEGAAPTSVLHTLERHGRAEAMNWELHAKKAKSGPSLPGQVDIILNWLLDLPDAGPESFHDTGGPSELLYELGLMVGESETFPRGFYIGHEAISRSKPHDWWAKPSANRSIFFAAECHLGLGGLGKGGFLSRPRTDADRPIAPNEPIQLGVDAGETILRQTKALLKDERFYSKIFPSFERASDALLAFARGFHSYRCTELNLGLLAEAAKIDLGVRAVDPEGRQFVNVLRYMDQKHDFLDEYTEVMRELVPDLKKVKIVDASDTHKRIDLLVGKHRYFLPEMSDGTLRALWLALLLFSPEQGSVLALDEPELNLHPAWLKVVGGWLQRFRSAQQIFVSTHSPDLLDSFTEGFRKGDVVLFVFDVGEKGMHRLEPGELDEFFREGWQLGDLYRIAEPKLGGWPW